MELFANIVDFIHPLNIFAKHSILHVSHDKFASNNTKQKLGAFSFISQKIRTAIAANFSYF